MRCGPSVHFVVFRFGLCHGKFCEPEAIKLIRIVAVVWIKLTWFSGECKARSSWQHKAIIEFKRFMHDGTSAIH